MRARQAVNPAQWEALLARTDVTAAWIPSLVVYLGLLDRFKDAVDLVAPGGAEELVLEHIVESLAGAPLLPSRGELLDMGSGAGLPGVPLLIALPQWTGTLVEPRERRWAFLREVVREVGLACEVRRERIAAVTGQYDALTVRALAVRVWAPAATRLLRETGRVLWWTTEERPEEVTPSELVPVVTSPLPDRRRGAIRVLRRRST